MGNLCGRGGSLYQNKENEKIKGKLFNIHTIDIRTEITTTTDLRDTGVHVDIPANSWYSITFGGLYGNAKCLEMAVYSQQQNEYILSAAQSHYGCFGTLSAFTSGALRLKMYTKYEKIVTNRVTIKGFYITKS